MKRRHMVLPRWLSSLCVTLAMSALFTAPVFGGNWAGSFATRGVEHYVPTDDQLDIFEDDGECSDCHTDLLTDEEIADRRCNVCKAAWEALEAGAAVDMA